MRTLGMIGGTSWHSTVVYYRRINELAAEKLGSQSNPELILHSIAIDIMRRQNKPEIEAKYLEVARQLEQSGAEAILICANTPHMVYPVLQPQISIPILHIADATGQAASGQNLKQLGLLGTRPVMTGDFITSVIQQNYDIHTLLPDEKYQQEVHDYIANELTQGIFSEEAKRFFIDQSAKLQTKGAEGIILGCTELPILLEGIDLGVPALATTDLHIQMAIDFIFSAS